MSDDRRRPAQYASLRDDQLRHWVSADVYPYSRLLRPELDRLGLGRNGVKTVADLHKLPILEPASLGAGYEAVLAPSPELIKKYAPFKHQFRYRRAELVRAGERYLRQHFEPRYRPLRWTLSSDQFVAWTGVDLNRLGDLGLRALSTAGVDEGDQILSLSPLAGHVAMWQLQAGLRITGVALLQLDRADAAVQSVTRANVIAGTVAELRRAAGSGLPSTSTRLLVVDERLPTAAERVELAATGLPVTVWWAPPGARTTWSECSGGEATGFHTFPDAEYLEIVDANGAPADEGEILWSAVGWLGSVWFRYRTGVRGRLETAACPACGRTTPRLLPIESEPDLLDVLAAHPRVGDAVLVVDNGFVVGALVRPVERSGARELRDELRATLDINISIVGGARLRAIRAAADTGDVVERSVVAAVVS